AQADPVVRLIQRSSSGDRIVKEIPVKVEQESSVPGDLVQIAVVDSDDTALSNINSIPIDVGHAAFVSPVQAAAPGSGTVAAGGGAVAAGSGAVAPQTLGNPPPATAHKGPGGGITFYGPRTLKAKPAVINCADLPRGFGSYDSLDGVVLGSAPLSQLDLDQGKALRLWVAAGGLLIFTGATDFSGLRAAGGLDPLLPVDPVGSETVTAVPELTNLYGSFDSTDPILIMRARLRAGARVLVGTTERPIVAEKSFGKGSVRFVAVDPRHNPVRGWKGSAGLWQDVLL